MRTTRGPVLGCLLLLSVACGSPGGGGGTDAGTPRTLARVGLFGDTPTENRFLDPLLSGEPFGWYAFEELQLQPAPLRRLTFTDLPAGRNALQVSGTRLVVAGYGMGGEGPLHAEVWVGQGAGGFFDGVTVTLVGNDPVTGRDVTLELAPDDTYDTDTLSWQRFSVDVTEGLFGWTALVVRDPVPGTLYLAAPMLVRAPAPEGLALRAAPPSRAPTAPEREALAAFRRHVGESWGAAPQVAPPWRRTPPPRP